MKSTVPVGSLAYPALTPAIYSKLHAEVNAACDEMVGMNVESPNQELLGRMTNRVFENVKKEHPDLEKYARAYERNVPQASAMLKDSGVDIQQGGAFLGLIAFLLLVGFFGRRRIRRGRRF